MDSRFFSGLSLRVLSASFGVIGGTAQDHPCIRDVEFYFQKWKHFKIIYIHTGYMCSILMMGRFQDHQPTPRQGYSRFELRTGNGREFFSDPHQKDTARPQSYLVTLGGRNQNQGSPCLAWAVSRSSGEDPHGRGPATRCPRISGKSLQDIWPKNLSFLYDQNGSVIVDQPRHIFPFFNVQ